ncbi:MAG: bifunctional 4-hydroxy-2-oxoglutarate aldolase/2-dehydro-3-deoxy-phosphogluconate aldolase [Spirochaetaceae bacterium]|jgi:2-dehydro-3-deoxyphosphogluconate aldolase/(4S)-4-hydroxy-2-oxoglutarate aldolase|nr:bifunctional 4-hydroxy-2-oxoglutarate aldolase/2-dehydro-3-deoxy-phosphogluconate aldolase [Spirochaetaceae bacterium]
MREKVITRIHRGKLIAIVRGMEEGRILPLAEALYKGGITMIEVTFNQKDPESFPTTARAIRGIRTRFGEDVYAGAGTVLSTVELHMAADAGALYIISPNADEEIIRETRRLGLVSLPGVLTAGECVMAHKAGADFLKLFPIGSVGAAYLKALKAPLGHLHFLGVGGVDTANIGEFLAAGAAGFGVGGKLVNKEWIDAGAFDRISALAAEYVQAVGGKEP